MKTHTKASKRAGECDMGGGTGLGLCSSRMIEGTENKPKTDLSSTSERLRRGIHSSP